MMSSRKRRIECSHLWVFLPEDAEWEARKGRFVEGTLTAVEADLAEPLQSTYTFRLAGEMLVLRDENGYVAVWQRVPEHTGVSAASWGQVKAQGR